MSASVEDYSNHIKEIKEAGKYYATVSGILQAAYFAAISFSELKRILQPGEAWPFFVPLALWVLTLVFSLLVMMPDRPLNRWLPRDRQLRRWLKLRQSLLTAAAVLFFAGLLWMAVDVIYYLFFMYIPPTKAPTIVITPCP
jgi:hypothetical protein